MLFKKETRERFVKNNRGFNNLKAYLKAAEKAGSAYMLGIESEIGLMSYSEYYAGCGVNYSMAENDDKDAPFVVGLTVVSGDEKNTDKVYRELLIILLGEEGAKSSLGS